MAHHPVGTKGGVASADLHAAHREAAEQPVGPGGARAHHQAGLDAPHAVHEAQGWGGPGFGRHRGPGFEVHVDVEVDVAVVRRDRGVQGQHLGPVVHLPGVESDGVAAEGGLGSGWCITTRHSPPPKR